MRESLQRIKEETDSSRQQSETDDNIIKKVEARQLIVKMTEEDPSVSAGSLMKNYIRSEQEMNMMISYNKKKWKRIARENLTISKQNKAEHGAKFHGKRPISDVVDPFEIIKRPKTNFDASSKEDHILAEAANYHELFNMECTRIGNQRAIRELRHIFVERNQNLFLYVKIN